MPSHGLGGDQPRRGAARDQRGGDDDVEGLDRVGERLLLLGALLRRSARGRSRPRRRPRSRGPATWRRATRPARPSPGARRSPSSAAPRRRAVASACRPATPMPSTSTLRRRDRARGGHEHRVEAGRRRSAPEQRRLVARDVGLRAQRVHRLRARDARDRLHRKGRRALVAQAGDARRVAQRREEADEDAAVAEAVDLRRGRRRDLDDDVGRPRVAERGAGVGVEARPGSAPARRHRARRRSPGPWRSAS